MKSVQECSPTQFERLLLGTSLVLLSHRDEVGQLHVALSIYVPGGEEGLQYVLAKPLLRVRVQLKTNVMRIFHGLNITQNRINALY